jgi:ribosomal protein S18 acetylase RimI-like enzyme
MRIQMRPYAGEADRRAMLALVRAFPEDNLHVLDLPYRLSSWALDDAENVGLWEDAEGRLRAWAALQTPFASLDYAYDPQARDLGLGPAILTWAIRRATAIAGRPNGRPAWQVSMREDQTDRLADAERAGFTRDPDAAQVVLTRPTGPAPPAPRPAGFAIRPLAGAAEAEAYAALHRAAFGTPNMTAAWKTRAMQTPEYRPELDLVMQAPDGRLAAFCVGWLGADAAGGPVGQVEPFGVSPEFRRLGLGRALLSEGIRRMQALGARETRVQTDLYRDAAVALYERAGFRLAQRIVVCRRVFPAAASVE